MKGKSMNYSILAPDLWARKVYPLLQECFGKEAAAGLPSPASASIAVAEDDAGDVQGAMFLQLAWMGQPFCCRSGKGVSVSKLHETIESQLPTGSVYYCFVLDETKARAAAEKNGMIEMKGVRVYQKQV